MKELKKLIEVCDMLGATVMSFRMISTGSDVPTAIIEDKIGRLSDVRYDYDKENWI